jgi:hypothetical protein
MAELVRLAQLHHHPTDNIDAVDLDFLDTIQFPSGEMVIVLGHFATVPEPHTLLTRPLQDHASLWWYEILQNRLSRHDEQDSLYVPVHDYLFRYRFGWLDPWRVRGGRFSPIHCWSDPSWLRGESCNQCWVGTLPQRVCTDSFTPLT